MMELCLKYNILYNISSAHIPPGIKVKIKNNIRLAKSKSIAIKPSMLKLEGKWVTLQSVTGNIFLVRENGCAWHINMIEDMKREE